MIERLHLIKMMLVFELRLLMMEYIYNQMDNFVFSALVIVIIASGLFKTNKIVLTPYYLLKFGVYSFTFGIFNKKYYNVLNWGKIPTIHKSPNNKRKKCSLQLRTYYYGNKHLHHGHRHHSSKRHNRMVRKIYISTTNFWQYFSMCVCVHVCGKCLQIYTV